MTFHITEKLRKDARARIDLIRAAQRLMKGLEGTYAGDAEIAALLLKIEELETLLGK